VGQGEGLNLRQRGAALISAWVLPVTTGSQAGGRVVGPDVDVFDREGAFIERVLAGPLRLAATITS